MATLNKVFIIGNLGADPELRYTPNQTAVATLRVATTDRWTGKDGQQQESTEWHRIIVWGKQAENASKFLTKGRPVFVEGRLQTRSWDDKQTGQKRFSTEITASTIQFLGGPSGGASYQSAPHEMGQDTQNYGGGMSMGGYDAISHFPQADQGHSSQIRDSSGFSDISEVPF